MENSNVSVRFNLKKSTGSEMIIRAIIHFGFKDKKYPDMENWVSKENIDRNDGVFGLIKQEAYKPIKISTGLPILSKFFDVKNQVCTGKYAGLNNVLDSIKENIEKVYKSIPEDKINIKFLTEQFNRHVFKKKSKEIPVDVFNNDNFNPTIPTNLVDYIQYKMDYAKKLGTRGAKTIKAYGNFRNWIEKFEKENKEKLHGGHIDLLTLQTGLIEYYLEWFLKQVNPKTKEPYSINYVHSFKKNWKMIVNQAREKDEIKVPIINWKKDAFINQQEEADDVYLTFEQLAVLKSLKFTKEEALARGRKFNSRDCDAYKKVRNFFIINCACGFRFSDMVNAKTLYKEGNDYYFRISRTVKTRTTNIKIPVFDNYVIKLWYEYDKQFPILKTDKGYRELIKEICKYAGFTDLIPVSKTVAATKKLETKHIPFYSLVSSKTARKTFCSNLVREYTVPLNVCTFYSGHSSEESYRNYIRLNEDEYSEITQRMEALTRFYNQNKQLFSKAV
jgi:hypothetical protein